MASTASVVSSLLVLVGLFANPTLVAAQSSQPLSVAAAVGISVGVTAVVCTLIACIVICLVFKRMPTRSANNATAGGSSTMVNSNNHVHENHHGLSDTQVLRFAEEGSGVAAGASAGKQNKVKGKDEPQTIAVKVNNPEDLRFKVCRNSDGAVLVANDPATDSLCSREGVRGGDQILGVYVNIKSAGASAHPKEVSELLSLASDYPLVVEFSHAGPVVKAPLAKSDAKHHRLGGHNSAAEVVLRRHRNRQSVDVADGPSSANSTIDETLLEQQQQQQQQQETRRHSRKLWSAPPPPVDRDSHFAIKDRRKRRRKQKGFLEQVEICQEEKSSWFDRLCKLHCEAIVEQDEWVWMPDSKLIVLPDSDEESSHESVDAIEITIDEDEVMSLFASKISSQASVESSQLKVATGRVERVFDFYELEEQDVVTSMPAPSELRPVTDCCTQYDGAEARAAESAVQNTWESLPNCAIDPFEPSTWQLLPNYQLEGLHKDAVSQAAASPTAEWSAKTTATVAEIDDDEDPELTTYLTGAASAIVVGDGNSLSSTSSPRTVQEEITVATVAASTPRQPPRKRVVDPQLVELTRSMALRDVEIATVILLDAEARQRQLQEDDAATLSSGRSTVQEDAIDPVTAPDRLAIAGALVERDLDNLEAMALDDSNSQELEYEVRDDELAEADLLNDDFEMAAAEWRAAHTLEESIESPDAEKMDATFDW